MYTDNNTNTRFQKFEGNKTFDGSEIPEGCVLVPVVMHKEDLLKDTVIKENLITWKCPNLFGESINVIVGFVPVKIELFDAMVSIFNAQERDYVNDKHVHSCADVSIDKLEEDMANPNKKVVDIVGTTKVEEQYKADSKMRDFIAKVGKENSTEATILQERRDEENKTKKKLAEEHFSDLGKSQGSARVKEILDRRDREYHQEYDD